MNFDDEDAELMDNNGLANFKDYEAYLDEQTSDTDLFYLEDKELARKLIEVGLHGKGEVLSRD